MDARIPIRKLDFRHTKLQGRTDYDPIPWPSRRILTYLSKPLGRALAGLVQIVEITLWYRLNLYRT